MNNSESYSNTDDFASATWPGPFWATEDYPCYPYPSVTQSTHEDFVSDPAYPSNAAYVPVPDFNAAGEAAFLHAPTAEIENPPTQLDCANGVSNQ